MYTKCNVNEVEHCQRCKDRICNKSSIIEHLLFSENERKLKGLNDVLSKFGYKITDFLDIKESIEDNHDALRSRMLNLLVSNNVIRNKTLFDEED